MCNFCERIDTRPVFQKKYKKCVTQTIIITIFMGLWTMLDVLCVITWMHWNLECTCDMRLLLILRQTSSLVANKKRLWNEIENCWVVMRRLILSCLLGSSSVCRFDFLLKFIRVIDKSLKNRANFCVDDVNTAIGDVRHHHY